MTLPVPVGSLEQLLKLNTDLTQALGWHSYLIKPSPRGAEAGRWANEHLRGRWTFKVHFGSVEFFIHDNQDAMLFKLTWGGDI